MKAKVVITFDDGDQSVIDRAFPVMRDNGQVGVFFINSNKPPKGLADLYAAGWDISNHTYSHKNLVDAPVLEMAFEINDCSDWLVRNGFERSAPFFAYPYGAYNDRVIEEVKRHHTLARTIIPEELGVCNSPYLLPTTYVPCYVKPKRIIERIDRLIERATFGFDDILCSLLFHFIVENFADIGLKYLLADFRQISDYLRQKQDAGKLEVITYSDYVEEQDVNISRDTSGRSSELAHELSQ